MGTETETKLSWHFFAFYFSRLLPFSFHINFQYSSFFPIFSFSSSNPFLLPFFLPPFAPYSLAFLLLLFKLSISTLQGKYFHWFAQLMLVFDFTSLTFEVCTCYLKCGVSLMVMFGGGSASKGELSHWSSLFLSLPPFCFFFIGRY